MDFIYIRLKITSWLQNSSSSPSLQLGTLSQTANFGMHINISQRSPSQPHAVKDKKNEFSFILESNNVIEIRKLCSYYINASLFLYTSCVLSIFHRCGSRFPYKALDAGIIGNNLSECRVSFFFGKRTVEPYIERNYNWFNYSLSDLSHQARHSTTVFWDVRLGWMNHQMYWVFSCPWWLSTSKKLFYSDAHK